MNILVIDVGTSSMRGILFTHTGQVLTEKQIPYQVTYLENSWVEQDSADWENALYDIVKSVSAAAAEEGWDVGCITLTSQRSSVIPVDADVRPLRPAIMWQDKRTAAICEALAGENDRIFALCGARVNPVFSASKMTWIRENQPGIYEKTAKFIVIPDLLLHRMTGRLCTDYTYGSRSLLMNLRTHRWDDELLALFRVERDKLCELVEPGSVVGTTTAEFSARTGCPAGIPVVTAGGDQQCGAIGQGVVKPGVLSVTAGTGGFLITAADRVPEGLESDVICNCSSVPGQYVLESSVLTCCSAFDWFRREFYPGSGYDEVNANLESAPVGANGCLCLPYFQGRGTPDWNSGAKAVFSGVTLGTTKADMLRSLLESICYEIGNGIDTMGKYLDIGDVYVNGGLTNSEGFNRIQSAVYGRTILRRGKTDATARGALMVAARAMGLYPTVEEAFRAIGKNDAVKAYAPDEESAKTYQTLKKRMNDLYGTLWPAGGKERSGDRV